MDIAVLDVIGDFAIALATVGLTAVGAWLTHSYRRRMRFELAEARRTAYSALWEITGLAASTRLDMAGLDGALTRAERLSLYQSMTDWYYQEGHGMLLENTTRNVYLKAKHNLMCATGKLEPPAAWEAITADLAKEDDERVRGVFSIRQLSLLRTQMKSDLAIFGQSYTKRLARHEHRFLEECGVDLRSEPWKEAVGSTDQTERPRPTAEPGQPLVIPRARSTEEPGEDPLRALWRMVESWRRGR